MFIDNLFNLNLIHFHHDLVHYTVDRTKLVVQVSFACPIHSVEWYVVGERKGIRDVVMCCTGERSARDVGCGRIYSVGRGEACNKKRKMNEEVVKWFRGDELPLVRRSSITPRDRAVVEITCIKPSAVQLNFYLFLINFALFYFPSTRFVHVHVHLTSVLFIKWKLVPFFTNQLDYVMPKTNFFAWYK